MDLDGIIITGPDGTSYRLTKVPHPVLSRPAADPLAPYRGIPASEMAKLITQGLRSSNVSGRELARQAGITNATMVSLHKGKRKRINPTTAKAVIEAIQRLARVV